MVKLSSESYHLTNIDLDQFWSKLDDITFGQTLNPELTYTTQYWGCFENTFAGRRKNNRFSIYLYRPITEGFRTEILAKGIVKKKGDGLAIRIKYEIPLWSILAFFFLGGFLSLWLWFSTSLVLTIILSVVFLFVYILILFSNHSDVKSEIKNQFIAFQKEEKRI